MTRLSLSALAIAAVIAAGCSDLGTPLKPKPQPQLSATALDFGTVAVSQSNTRSITITNAGTGTLLGDAAISCEGYSIETGGGPFALSASESRTVVVGFTPSTTGSFPCALNFGPNVPSIAIAGAGALQPPGAHCLLLQDSLAFGAVNSGESAVAAFAVINDGTAPLLVNIVSPSSEFRIIMGGGPAEIPAGSSVAVTMVFSPAGSGRILSQVDIGPGCPIVVVSGLGITVSFGGNVKPILNARCTGSACHSWSSETAEPYRYTLITAPGQVVNGSLVYAFDLDRSILYQKIIRNPAFPPPMPYGGPPLPADEIETFRRWIAEGARDN